jgi:hypothetical protein
VTLFWKEEGKEEDTPLLCSCENDEILILSRNPRSTLLYYRREINKIKIYKLKQKIEKKKKNWNF